MLLDLEHTLSFTDTTFDVCIVGAGAAGITLAVELARQGRCVAVLEGGGQTLEDTSQDMYRTETPGLHHSGASGGRFRGYGGTTTRWGGQILELDAIDFRERSWIPGSGWPFPKTELIEYYRRATALEGVDGSESDDNTVWKALGMERPFWGEALVPYLTRWCPEPKFSVLHARTLEQHPNIRVFLHANAVGLNFQNSSERIDSVRCKTLTGRSVAFKARQFVLCMGAIETSRFLLQAHPSTPWNSNGLVGQYFQDHVDINTADIEPLDAKRFSQNFDHILWKGFKYHPKFKPSDQWQEEMETLNIGSAVHTEDQSDDAVLRLKSTAKKLMNRQLSLVGVADLLHAAKNFPVLARQALYLKRSHRIYHSPSSKFVLRVHCEQEPFSKSTIKLSESRDALGMRRPKLDWRISSLERLTIRKYTEFVQRQFMANGLARLSIYPDIYDDASLESRSDDGLHHMGGIRMSDSPGSGVVDRNLRLNHTENVFVCSAAVFPASGFSNPTHTLLALAMRLADHLAIKAADVPTDVLSSTL